MAFLFGIHKKGETGDGRRETGDGLHSKGYWLLATALATRGRRNFQIMPS